MTDTTIRTNFANRGPVQPTDSAASVLRPGTRGRITSGLWRDSRSTNALVSIPDGWDRLVEAGNIHNLELAAGTTTGDYRNDLPFMDSDLYKWLEAVGCLLGGNDPDTQTRERLMAHIDKSVAVLGAAQEDDGYLNSYVQVIRPDRRWLHLDWGHEHYSAGHLIQAAVAVARGTGRTDLLDIACRLADRIDADFGIGPGKIDGVDGHPEIEMALVELYRVTGEQRYLELARYFVDRRGHGLLAVARYTDRNFGSMYWQDHTPVREATEVGGHAVRQLYLLCRRGRHLRRDRRQVPARGGRAVVGGDGRHQDLPHRRRRGSPPRRVLRRPVRAAQRACATQRRVRPSRRSCCPGGCCWPPARLDMPT